MAAVLLTVALIVLISMLAYAERIPRPIYSLREGDTVKVQARAHVFVPAKVLRVWSTKSGLYAEVADEHGERYIRPIELLERP